MSSLISPCQILTYQNIIKEFPPLNECPLTRLYYLRSDLLDSLADELRDIFIHHITVRNRTKLICMLRVLDLAD